MADCVIASFLKRHMRELVIRELELLQTQRIHRIGGQPFQHLGQSHGQ